MNSTQLIDRLNKFYKILGTDKKYSFLITGNWGIGKTYTYNEFVKSKRNKNYYYSLFGISSLRELEKMILKDIIFPDLKKLDEKTSPKVLGEIIGGVLKDLGAKNTVNAISPNNILETLTFRDLKFTPKSLVCLDDLERCKIPMEDLMGFIERLKQKSNVIVLCNEKEVGENQAKEERNNKKVYKAYKEKVIDFIYSLEEVEDNIVLSRISKLKITKKIQKKILKEFRGYSKNNIRVLDKFTHLFREVYFHIEDSFDKVLSERARLKLALTCFYVVCEEELNLIENKISEFIDRMERIPLSLDNERKKMSKSEREKHAKEMRENKYSNVYEFYYYDACKKIEKFYRGDKLSLDEIIDDFNLKLDETREFLEEKVKLYFLEDKKGIFKIKNEIEFFLKIKVDLEYYDVRFCVELYVYYLYLCKVLDVEINEKVKVKIIELLKLIRIKKGKNFHGLGVWLDMIRDDILLEVKEEINYLKQEIESVNFESEEEKLLQCIQNKNIEEAEKILKNLEKPYKIFIDSIGLLVDKKISIEESYFWDDFLRKVVVAHRNKLEELRNKIEENHEIHILKRKTFLHILDLEKR